ncbi:hypothetical protein HK102_006448, partial [Quaeritorhiza haematococci]
MLKPYRQQLSYLPLWDDKSSHFPSSIPTLAPPLPHRCRILLVAISAISLLATSLNITFQILNPNPYRWVPPSSIPFPTQYIVSESRDSMGGRVFSMVHPNYAERLKEIQGLKKLVKQVMVMTVVQGGMSWGRERSFQDYLRMVGEGFVYQQEEEEMRSEGEREEREKAGHQTLLRGRKGSPLYDISIALLVSDEKEYVQMRSTLLNLKSPQNQNQNDSITTSGLFFWSVTLLNPPPFPDQFSISREQRHADEVQAERRRTIARLRNYLLYSAMKPHTYAVVWIDADIVEIPDKSLLERIITNEDKDIVTV